MRWARRAILSSCSPTAPAAQLAWLAEHLASHGFIAAAVNHHGNTAAEDEPVPQAFVLFWERAADLSRVLDRLLDDPMFAPRIDKSRIGAVGYSLGGYSVLSVAGARTSIDAFEAFCASPAADISCQAPPEFPDALERFDELRQHDPIVQSSLERHGESYRDERVRGVYAIAPAVGMALTEESLRSLKLPVRILVGDADAVVPAKTNGLRVAGLVGGCELKVLDGVGHYTFLAECTPRGKKYVPVCRDADGVDRTSVHREVAEDVRAFMTRVLGGS